MDEPKIDAMILENHPQDSRVKIKEDGIFQALTAQMGLGGGNVPLLMIRRNDIEQGNDKE